MYRRCSVELSHLPLATLLTGMQGVLFSDWSNTAPHELLCGVLAPRGRRARLLARRSPREKRFTPAGFTHRGRLHTRPARCRPRHSAV